MSASPPFLDNLICRIADQHIDLTELAHSAVDDVPALLRFPYVDRHRPACVPHRTPSGRSRDIRLLGVQVRDQYVPHLAGECDRDRRPMPDRRR